MDLHLQFAEASGRSKRARLETALREAVQSGQLGPGTRLPATRALCVALGVSRGVAVDAYAQLVAEGYLEARRGGGTTVAAGPLAPSRPRAPSAPSRSVRFDLDPSAPAVGEFPRSAWAAALTHVVRAMPDVRLGPPDPMGTRELRGVLSDYLARARGVRAAPEQIVITAGTRHGIGLLWAMLAARGVRAVAVESPGWPGVQETIEAAGLRAIPVPVDDDGLVTGRLAGLAGLDAVAVAPAHQYPTGAVLCTERRHELLAWVADSPARLILEDDYDAEYRYDRQPIGCLQGLRPDRVVYAGSTSKTLSPALGLGWLVAPEPLVASIAEIARRRGGNSAVIPQLALARFIERGDLDRHLRRQRRRYHERRVALLRALARHLCELSVTGESAGLYATVALPAGIDAETLADSARRRGIALTTAGSDALVLGYANLAASAADEAVRALAASIEDARTTVPRAR